MESNYEVNIEFIKRKLNKKAYIFGPKGCYELNELSEFIYEKLMDEMRKSEIISAIMNEYDIDKETVESDVNKIIGFFELNQIIHIVE